MFVVCVLCNFVIASTVRIWASECGIPNLWGASPLSCNPLRTTGFELAAKVRHIFNICLPFYAMTECRLLLQHVCLFHSVKVPTVQQEVSS